MLQQSCRLLQGYYSIHELLLSVILLQGHQIWFEMIVHDIGYVFMIFFGIILWLLCEQISPMATADRFYCCSPLYRGTNSRDITAEQSATWRITSTLLLVATPIELYRRRLHLPRTATLTHRRLKQIGNAKRKIFVVLVLVNFIDN